MQKSDLEILAETNRILLERNHAQAMKQINPTMLASFSLAAGFFGLGALLLILRSVAG